MILNWGRGRSKTLIGPVFISTWLTPFTSTSEPGPSTGVQSNHSYRIGKGGIFYWNKLKGFDEETLAAWENIQDQINAGYLLYIQPTLLTGSYEKTFDFGAVFDNILLTLEWNENQVEGNTSVLAELKYSTDNVTYSSYVVGRSLFIPSARYIRAKFTFTADDNRALLEFYGLVAKLNVKTEVDSGSVIADEDDVGGTVVLFNKDFKDINSITLAAESTTPVKPVYDFVDIPNPVSFKVLAFNDAGARVTILVSWKARGIT